MVKIGKRVVETIPVPAPPIEVQHRISELVGTWVKGIEVTGRLLDSALRQKKALAQQLLTGKRRLPGFQGEWERLKAEEVFRPVSIRGNPDEPLLAVTQDQGIVPRHLLERRVVMPEGSTATYKLVVPGNFVISLRSFQGGIEYADCRGLVSPAYTVLEPVREIHDAYYGHYFKSTEFIGRLAVAVIGIRDGKQISYRDFSFIKTPVPPINEQKAIAEVLDQADGLIRGYQQQKAKLELEKRALMQQLLTGKRRVKLPSGHTTPAKEHAS
jgi:type I restriction enzyme S subunit